MPAAGQKRKNSLEQMTSAMPSITDVEADIAVGPLSAISERRSEFAMIPDSLTVRLANHAHANGMSREYARATCRQANEPAPGGLELFI
jgi:hypothetical protein